MNWLASILRALADAIAPAPTIERPSPKVRINRDQVHIKDGVLTVTGLGRCFIAAIAPSNSDEPFIDDGMFTVNDPDIPASDLIEGDVIWYKSSVFEAFHPIKKIGKDNAGWFAICKGYNNSQDDPGKVRFADIIGTWRGTQA